MTEDAQGNHSVAPPTAGLNLEGQTVGISVFQFVGLFRAMEYNAMMAANAGDALRSVYGTNTLLAAYAALEALVLETAYVKYRPVYARSNFRSQQLTRKYMDYLAVDDRPVQREEDLPRVIAHVARQRAALTHSEPDNPRSGHVGTITTSPEALHDIVTGVRELARWLWRDQPPRPVGIGFNDPNPYI